MSASPAADPARFYDQAYAATGEQHVRWRELGAVGKADHVQELLGRLGAAPERILEVGCGDGALLAELARRGIAPSLTGFDISEQAVRAARARAIDALESVEVFDGRRLPVADGAFEAGVLSHVLEHVADPVALLRETARAARVVIVEVPLEDSLSGRRACKRERSAAIGHLAPLDRERARALVAEAGLRVAAELLDPLPASVIGFFAATPAQRARARLKAGIRRAAFRASP
ncbi:MAG TPA: class I SAM-dependent methyltransferase, partial [Thermoleophilaceae bacterium]